MARVSDAKHAGVVVGGIAAALGAAVGVLAAEGMHAKRRAGVRHTAPPYADRRYGPRSGTSYRLAVLGDSGAAGLGATDPEQTVGALLATGLANLTDRGVVLSTMAVVGAQSRDLAPQVDRALQIRPHVAVIMIGANDVTHLRGTRRPVGELVEQVARLRAEGVEVVVGTCPDLSTVRLFPQPLRSVAGQLSGRMARAQGRAAANAGARVVPLAALLGGEFGAWPDVFFSADLFHPSADGYAAAAAAMLPSVLMAVGEPDLVARLAADDADTGAPGLPSSYPAPSA